MRTALALLLVSLFPATALAAGSAPPDDSEEATADEPDDDPADDPAESMPESAPAEPAPATAPAPEPTPIEPAAAKKDIGRFRWGVNLGAGTFIPGPTLSFGGGGRAGWQFSDIFGVSAAFDFHGGVGIGFSANATGGSISVSAASFWALGADAELMLGHIFFISGGPRLVKGGWGTIREGGDVMGNVMQTAIAAGGWMPGADVKIGLGFGKPRKSGYRFQFTVAIDTMFLFAPNSAYVEQTVMGGNVIQEVETNKLAVGIAPMLMFGFEMR